LPKTIIEPIVQVVATDPYELLIKEARQIQQRHRRRLWAITLALVFVTVAVLAAFASRTFDRSAPRTSNGIPSSEVAGALPRCDATQLRVSGHEANGAAVSFGWIVRLRNEGVHGCSLSGYPSVRGINQWNGAVLIAAHTLNSYLGGWPSDKIVHPVDLKAKGGVASFLIDFVAGNNIRACPYVTSLRISVPHSRTVFSLKSQLQVCKYFQVHPFVAGRSGGNL
jgi:hypothetical protein